MSILASNGALSHFFLFLPIVIGPLNVIDIIHDCDWIFIHWPCGVVLYFCDFLFYCNYMQILQYTTNTPVDTECHVSSQHSRKYLPLGKSVSWKHPNHLPSQHKYWQCKRPGNVNLTIHKAHPISSTWSIIWIIRNTEIKIGHHSIDTTLVWGLRLRLAEFENISDTDCNCLLPNIHLNRYQTRRRILFEQQSYLFRSKIFKFRHMYLLSQLWNVPKNWDINESWSR